MGDAAEGLQALDEHEEAPEDELEDELEPNGKLEEEELQEEDYGKKVQKRINKEVAKRKTLEDQLETANKHSAEMDVRMRRLEEQIDETEISSMDAAKSRLTERYQEAVDEENTEAQEAVLDELTKHNSRRTEIATKRQSESEKRPDEEGPQERKQHPAAKGFLKRHEKEFEENEEMLDRARELEKEMRDEGAELGYDLYRELDRRLSEEFTEEEPAPRKRSRVAGKSRGEGGRRRSGNHLTEADKQTMTTYGLDNQDPVAIKAYLKHKGGE